MTEISFEFDWVDSEGIRGAELSETWAALKITARDSVVTRIQDERAKTLRDFVFVPLYPLAEWLATNWWFLASEYQNPDRQNDREFRRRHFLSANREGYAFPDLEVISSGTRTTLAWKRYAPQWTRVEFIGQGHTSVDGLEFRDACSGLIDSVIRRLYSRGVEDTLLQQEWDAIQETEICQEEVEFCETAAGLGWDPYDLDESQRDAILSLADEFGDFVGEAVQALDASALSVQSSAIASAIRNARQNGLPLNSLRNFTIDFRRDVKDAPPWNVGYNWARKLRSELSLDGRPLPSMATLAMALGEEESVIDGAARPVATLNRVPLVDGLVAVNQDESASFAFRPAGEHSRRFNFCRALGEYLASPQTGSLVTKSHSERQQFNRAFAAEFLAPSGALKAKVSRSVVHDDEIDELAGEFGVSPFVIRHQLENHRIAEVYEPSFRQFA